MQPDAFNDYAKNKSPNLGNNNNNFNEFSSQKPLSNAH